MLWVASVPHGVQASLMCSSPFVTSIDRTRMGFSQAGQIHMGGGDEASNSRGWGMAPPHAGKRGLHHDRGGREDLFFAHRRNLLVRSGIRMEGIVTPPEARTTVAACGGVARTQRGLALLRTSSAKVRDRQAEQRRADPQRRANENPRASVAGLNFRVACFEIASSC